MDPRAESMVRETVAVAAELGASASQVALAWLFTRATPVMPILGAMKGDQLAENLAALDVDLAPEQIERLGAASAIDLGFPHELLAREGVRPALRRTPSPDPGQLGRRDATEREAAAAL